MNRNLPRGVFLRGNGLVYFSINLKRHEAERIGVKGLTMMRRASSIEAASVERSAAILRLRRGEYPFPVAATSPARGRTVGGILAAYVARSCRPAVEGLRGHKTRHRYAANLTAFFGAKDAETLRPGDLDAFAATRRPASPRGDMDFLRGALNFARENGIVSRSVFDALGRTGRKRLMPPSASPFQRVTDEDFAAIVARMNPAFERPLRFLLSTGMRSEEAFRLTWEALDTAGTVARLTHTKSGVPRSVPLGSAARRLLGRRGSGLVFPGPAGRAQGPAIKKAWQRARRPSGINRRVHDLRGEFACRFIEAGGTLPEAMAICGWSSLKIVERYLKASLPHAVAVLDRLHFGSARKRRKR